MSNAPVAVYVSAGSNIEPEENLQLAARELSRRFGSLRVSPVYKNAAVGFSGDDFLNCVFAFASELPPAAVVAQLEELHALAGRVRSAESFSPRTLDLDLLLYGDLIMPERPVRVPRDDITRFAFVLRPLADLAPSLRHPVLGASIADLWAEFSGRDEPMERVMLPLDPVV
ncbi:MAG: 2-amino-4-hydroxy-6-hydroxymethyldihydropteridine diphosphokinase [Gammaproteobacteria bacterium]